MKNYFVNPFVRRSLSLVWLTLLVFVISCKDTSTESTIRPSQPATGGLNSARITVLAGQIAADADYIAYLKAVSALQNDIQQGLAKLSKKEVLAYRTMHAAGNTKGVVSSFLVSKVKKYAQYQSTMSTRLASLTDRHALSTQNAASLQAIFAQAHQLTDDTVNPDAGVSTMSDPINPDPGWGDDPEDGQNPDDGQNPGDPGDPGDPDGPGTNPDPGGGGGTYYPSGFTQSDIYRLVTRCFGNLDQDRIGGMVIGIINCAVSNNTSPTSEDCLRDALSGYVQDSLQCIFGGLLIPQSN